MITLLNLKMPHLNRTNRVFRKLKLIHYGVYSEMPELSGARKAPKVVYYFPRSFWYHFPICTKSCCVGLTRFYRSTELSQIPGDRLDHIPPSLTISIYLQITHRFIRQASAQQQTKTKTSIVFEIRKYGPLQTWKIWKYF